MHRNRFVIISQPRSGSTLIRTALNQHRAICCQGELFAQTAVTGYELGTFAETGLALREKVRQVRESAPYDHFMENYVFPEDDTYDAFGVKVLDRHFALEKIGPFLFDFIKSEPTIKLIFLHRQDQLAQFVSHKIKNQKLDPSQREFLPPADFEEHLKRARALRDRIWSAYPDHPQCHLSFEHVMQDPEKALQYLCGFIGVPYQPLVIEGRPSTLPDDPNFIANYPRLRDIWIENQEADPDRFGPRVPHGLRLARKISWIPRAAYWAGRFGF